jgi:hypothetical protein
MASCDFIRQCLKSRAQYFTYEHIQAAGKPSKPAIIAYARKLLTVATTSLGKQTPRTIKFASGNTLGRAGRILFETARFNMFGFDFRQGYPPGNSLQ